MVKSATARAYQEAVALLCLKYGVGRGGPVFPKPVRVRLTLTWYRPRTSRGDLDNRLKILLDSLQGALYANDRQIRELHVYEQDGGDRGRVVVDASEAA